MKNRIAGLKNNKRLMFGTRFFLELKSINSVVQLFYLSRGLDLGQIIYLSLVWTATAFVCDIPSSYLADKFGRKKLIVFGIFLTSLSTFLLFFANGFAFFVIAYIIGAAGYSFFMGVDHAIIYDSVKEAGEESGVNRIAGKYFSSQSLPKIVMPLLGSLIARDLLSWQFMILIGIDFIGTLTSMIMAMFLTEPKIENRKTQKYGILKQGFKLIMSDKTLLKFALNKIIMFQATFVYWRVYQVLLKNANMPTIYLGLVYTVFQTILFLMFWNTEKVQNKIGKMNFILYPQILGLLAIAASLLTSNLAILFGACVMLLIVGTIRDPLFLTQMQARIPSFNRATATSTLNTLKNITDIPLLFLVGYLAKSDINYVMLVSLSLFLISLMFTRIKKEELVV